MVLLSACTDLDTNELDSTIVENTGGSATGDPGALLSSTYDDLRMFVEQNNTYSLFTHTTDEMIPPTRGTDWGDNGVWRQLHTHSWDPTHAYVLNSWNELNQRAYKCNQVLASNPSTAQAAEAKFLRGFYTWHILDLFGKVPFRNVGEGVNVNPKVYTRSEAFDLVVKDLEESLAGLANTGPKPVQNVATRAAANAMLARLYLNKAVYKSATPEGPYTFDNADMDKVIEYVDAVTAAGYELEDQYFVNFSVNAQNEIIFTSPQGTAENRYRMTLHYNNNPDGWNGFATLADFYAKFENQDQRKGKPATPNGSEYSGLARGFLLGQQFNDDGEPIVNSRNQQPLAFTTEVPLVGASSEQGIRVIKYHPADKGQYILLRYGDVYLMKVEALWRKGDDGAITLLNTLRNVRGATPLVSITEADLLDERGRELYWEGYRRVDQIRFGTFTSTWHEKTSTDAFRVLFPIPQQAIDSNPNLTQNKGYPGATE